MWKLLKVCLSPKVVILAVIGLGLLAAGLAIWGVAPQLILSALPVLGIIACLLPCLIPLYLLRRPKQTATDAAFGARKTDAKSPALPEQS